MKSYHHLTILERYIIFLLIQANCKKNFICFVLKISRSALYRELKRNSENLRYDPDKADSKSCARRKNCHKKPVMSDELTAEVIRMLQKKWSPEQISGRLKLEQKANISHQSIYNFIESDRRSGGEI